MDPTRLDSDRVEIRRIMRNGNSFCVVVPRSFLARLGWKRNDQLALRAVDDVLMVRKMSFTELGQMATRLKKSDLVP